MKSRRPLFLIVTALAILLVAGAVFKLFQFDRELWVAQADAAPMDNQRGEMLWKAERLLRPGLTMAEVETLLGPADSHTGEVWTYRLGVGGWGIDENYLDIVFGPDGKLISFGMSTG